MNSYIPVKFSIGIPTCLGIFLGKDKPDFLVKDDLKIRIDTHKNVFYQSQLSQNGTYLTKKDLS